MKTNGPGSSGAPSAQPPGGSDGAKRAKAKKPERRERRARPRPAGAMGDFALDMPPVHQGSRDSVIMLFLGLFLLVLTFFILLVSISTVEVAKSNAVMSSFNAAFQVTSKDDPEQAQEEDETVQSARLQDALADIFATSLGVEKVEILQRGRLMRVQMQSRSVFEDDIAEVRESMTPLLNRIVAQEENRPASLRFEVEAVMHLPAGERGAMPAVETLEMRRARAFARAVINQGLPENMFAAGLYPSDESLMDLWFYIRPEIDLREDLAPEETAAPAAQTPAPQTAGQDGAVSIQLPGN